MKPQLSAHMIDMVPFLLGPPKDEDGGSEEDGKGEDYMHMAVHFLWNLAGVRDQEVNQADDILIIDSHSDSQNA
jgi:hypothetical protein